jgi:cyanophycinase
MGFLPEMIIDQHFAQHGRLGRLLAAVAERQDLLGVGLGEDTAMIVEGGTFRVIGRGVATVIDGSRATHNDAGRRRKDEPLTLSGLTLHTVGPGHVFDLSLRQVVPRESEVLADGRKG